VSTFERYLVSDREVRKNCEELCGSH